MQKLSGPLINVRTKFCFRPYLQHDQGEGRVDGVSQPWQEGHWFLHHRGATGGPPGRWFAADPHFVTQT